MDCTEIPAVDVKVPTVVLTLVLPPLYKYFAGVLLGFIVLVELYVTLFA